MPGRHWTPCRECGATHQNPMSSSLCPPCGVEAVNERKQREQAVADAREARLDRIEGELSLDNFTYEQRCDLRDAFNVLLDILEETD